MPAAMYAVFVGSWSGMLVGSQLQIGLLAEALVSLEGDGPSHEECRSGLLTIGNRII
jgi:hypothetical protein